MFLADGMPSRPGTVVSRGSRGCRRDQLHAVRQIPFSVQTRGTERAERVDSSRLQHRALIGKQQRLLLLLLVVVLLLLLLGTPTPSLEFYEGED